VIRKINLINNGDGVRQNRPLKGANDSYWFKPVGVFCFTGCQGPGLWPGDGRFLGRSYTPAKCQLGSSTTGIK